MLVAFFNCLRPSIGVKRLICYLNYLMILCCSLFLLCFLFSLCCFYPWIFILKTFLMKMLEFAVVKDVMSVWVRNVQFISLIWTLLHNYIWSFINFIQGSFFLTWGLLISFQSYLFLNFKFLFSLCDPSSELYIIFLQYFLIQMCQKLIG